MEDYSKYVGYNIHIIHLNGETNYDNIHGKISYIDDAGQIHGTWSSIAVIPDIDQFEIIDDSGNIIKNNY